MDVAEQLRQVILRDFDEAVGISTDSVSDVLLVERNSYLLTLQSLLMFCREYSGELNRTYRLFQEASKGSGGKEFVDLLIETCELKAEACETVLEDIASEPPIPGYSKEEAAGPYLSLLCRMQELLTFLASGEHVETLAEYLDSVLIELESAITA